MQVDCVNISEHGCRNDKNNDETTMMLLSGFCSSELPTNVRAFAVLHVLLLLLVLLGCGDYAAAFQDRRLCPLVSRPPPATSISRDGNLHGVGFSPSAKYGRKFQQGMALLCLEQRRNNLPIKPRKRTGRGRSLPRCGTVTSRNTGTSLEAAVSPAVTAAASAVVGAGSRGNAISPVGYLCMALLATQFAMQPILTKRYAPTKIIRSTYVLALDAVRFAACLSMLYLTSGWAQAVRGWNWKTSIQAAGVPAALYLVQNYCSLVAYQLLSPIAYNVLNQTKTVSAAFWCYVLMGRRQSPLQMLALVLLVAAATVIENPAASMENFSFRRSVRRGAVAACALLGTRKRETSHSGGEDDSELENAEEAGTAINDTGRTGIPSTGTGGSSTVGLLAILTASMISGLAGAWIQTSLQTGTIRRSSLLLTMELSFCSTIFLLAGLLVTGLTSSSDPARRTNNDSARIAEEGFWSGWTLTTWIPCLTNAAGGILVGLVTKHAGSVEKGFALIFGLFGSGLLQNAFSSSSKDGQHAQHHGKVAPHQWIGGLLAGISLWLHSAFPARP